MIGISFAYPDATDKFRRDWNELRVARIEPGPPNTIWGRGENREVTFYWRQWELPLDERTWLMDDIVKNLVRSHEVDGFTLWWNWTKKEWQMNVRRKDEAWSVNYISQAEAEAIFDTLVASHPDGPWSVRDYVQDDAAAAASVRSLNGSSAAARVERHIEDVFDSTIPELNLDTALRAAKEAVQRGIEVLGRVVA